MRLRVPLSMPTLVLPVLLPLCACGTTIRFPEIEPIKRANPEAVVAQYLGAARPATYEQRWILSSRGTEGVFTLYLKVTPPDSMHMVALSDLGSTLCEVTRTEVLRETPLFSGTFGQRILGDIKPFFLPAPIASYRLVRAEGELGIYREDGDERELWRRGKILFRHAAIAVQDWRRDENGRTLYPKTFEITGERYSAIVEVK